jgi:hypothetical protein
MKHWWNIIKLKFWLSMYQTLTGNKIEYKTLTDEELKKLLKQ